MTKDEIEKKFDKDLANKISKVQIYDNETTKKKSNIGKIFLLLIVIIIIIFIVI